MKVALPMRLPSLANLREHWRATAERKKAQRAAVRIAFADHRLREERENLRGHLAAGGSVRVLLTRVALQELDAHDNLRAAFKHVVDEVAAELGLKHDRDPHVEWAYTQTKGKPAVHVEVTTP